MKVSKNWLKELVDIKVSNDELNRLIPLRTIGIKEVTDKFIELDMKGYNRADLLSMRGVAHEVAAISGSKVKFEDANHTEFGWVGKNYPKIEVSVEDEKLCPVYCLAKITGLKVDKSSPEWISRLEESGFRPVNNIADVTNLVMLEYGQPLHAFDAGMVTNKKVIVRTARASEEIVTLDNKTRKLNKSDLLITDPKKAIGIAGVMGGKNSEVTATTRTILLEAAIFDPTNLRKTATRLALQSEASKRFYHGLTKIRLLQAVNAAIKMYQDLGGKVGGLTVVGDLEDQLKKVTLNLKKVNSLIGIDLEAGQVEDILKKLNFDLVKTTSDSWVVTPPYFRLDIEIEEDLIEEVARIYGYDRIPATKLPGKAPEKIDQTRFELIEKLKKTLVELGLTEVQTYSFFSSRVLENLGWHQDGNSKYLVKVANPISKETAYLRQNLWANLVEIVSKNLKQGVKEIAIFEVGKVYYPADTNIPNENYHLAITISNGSGREAEQIYQTFQNLMEILAKNLVPKQDQQREIERKLFHPTRFIHFYYRDKQIGGLAEVHPRILHKFGIEKRVAVLEIDISSFYNL